MANPLSRKYEYLYLEDLEGTVGDHELACQILAQDWTESQRESGVAVPRYLESHDSDIRQSLDITTRDLTETHFSNFEYENRVPILRSKLGSVMIEAANLADIRSMYENRDSEDEGVISVIYMHALIGNIADSKPDKAIDQIAEIASWNVPSWNRLLPIMHATIDTNIYAKAKNTKGMESAKGTTAYASSEASQDAMNSGLDYRVLRYAKRLKAEDDTFEPLKIEGFISEFASSELAAQALIECMSGERSMRNYPHSFKRLKARITLSDRDTWRRERRRVRSQKRHEEVMERIHKRRRDEKFITDELTKAAQYALAFLGYDLSEDEIRLTVQSMTTLLTIDKYDDSF